MEVFVTDYPTADGTCVRDYIHVNDLARAHMAALSYLRNGGTIDIFNCGYSKATRFWKSSTVKRVSKVDFPVKLSRRRPETRRHRDRERRNPGCPSAGRRSTMIWSRSWRRRWPGKNNWLCASRLCLRLGLKKIEKHPAIMELGIVCLRARTLGPSIWMLGGSGAIIEVNPLAYERVSQSPEPCPRVSDGGWIVSTFDVSEDAARLQLLQYHVEPHGLVVGMSHGGHDGTGFRELFPLRQRNAILVLAFVAVGDGVVGVYVATERLQLAHNVDDF